MLGDKYLYLLPTHTNLQNEFLLYKRNLFHAPIEPRFVNRSKKTTEKTQLSLQIRKKYIQKIIYLLCVNRCIIRWEQQKSLFNIVLSSMMWSIDMSFGATFFSNTCNTNILIKVWLSCWYVHASLLTSLSQYPPPKPLL